MRTRSHLTFRVAFFAVALSLGSLLPRGGAAAAQAQAPAASGATTAPGAADFAPIQATFDKHDYPRAERMLRDWLVMHPEDRNARFLYAHALMFQEKIGPSVAEFDRLLAVDPNNGDYLLGKGKALVRGGRYGEAIPVLERAKAIAPQTQVIYQLEIEALRNMGDHPRLQEVQQDAARRFPTFDWVAFANPPQQQQNSSRRLFSAPTVQAGFSYDILDNGFENWRSIYLEGSQPLGPQKNVYGLVEETRRFGQEDPGFTFGTNYPLGGPWFSRGEVGFSPTHHILPQYSLLGELGRTFPDAWAALVGAQHAQYDSAATDLQYLTIQKGLTPHLGAAYTVSLGEAGGGSSAVSHAGSLTYYYGTGNSFGVNGGIGSVITNLGYPLGLVKSETRDLEFNGVHWVEPSWAVVYNFGWHKLGGFFTRRSLGLALRHTL